MKNKLRKLLNEILPELTELSMGCIISTADNGELELINEKRSMYDGRMKMVRCYHCGDNRMLNYFKKDIEIIGHPIRIEHILRAIKKKYHSEDVLSYCDALIANRTCMDYEWDLSKPFDEQAIETYRFIYNLLSG